MNAPARCGRIPLYSVCAVSLLCARPHHGSDDDAVRMTLDVIRRIETQTEKHLEKPCSRISSGSPARSSCSIGLRRPVETPDGTIRTVLFPVSKKPPFHDLAAEAKPATPSYASGTSLSCARSISTTTGRCCHGPGASTFRSENRFQPVIEALGVIKQYMGTKTSVPPRGCPGGRRRAAQLARDRHRRARRDDTHQPAIL